MSPKHDTKVEREKAIVAAFLLRCRAWAQEREIPKRTQRITECPTAADAAKLHAWISYDAFLDHTLQELEDGTLDHWFDDGKSGTAGERVP